MRRTAAFVTVAGYFERLTSAPLCVDGANIEIAEEVGENNVFFFGHLTPAVEDLRYQHMYHPQPIEQKCPALAKVISEIAAGRFGDGGVYEP